MVDSRADILFSKSVILKYEYTGSGGLACSAGPGSEMKSEDWHIYL